MGQSYSKPQELPNLQFTNTDRNGVKSTYTVEEELGSGAFGKVYKVQDENGAKYALKVVKGLLDKTKVDAAKKEAKNLEKINHPNVIKHYCSFTQKEGNGWALCILMEIVDGINLEKLLSRYRKPPDYSFVLKLFLQLLDVLHVMHQHKIVHRDIKPANIIVFQDKITKEIGVKLADFGLSIELERESGTLPNIGGTIAYLAPEVIQPSLGKSSNKVDIWSAGLILYQALTLNDDFTQSRYGWYSYFPSHPRAFEEIDDLGLRTLVQHMLTPDPSKRLPAKELVSHNLVKGWKDFNVIKKSGNIEFDPRYEERSKYYFSACVSLLCSKCPYQLVQKNLTHLLEFVDHEHIRQGVLSLQIVPKLCKLINLPSEHKKSVRTEEVHFADQSHNFNLPNDFFDQEKLNENNNNNFKPKISVSNLAIALLGKLLKYPDSHVLTAHNICHSNHLSTIVECYKRIQIGMDDVLGELCKVPYVCNELQKCFGLEHILVSVMNSSTPRYGLTVYEKLITHRLPYGVEVFFSSLFPRGNTSIMNHVMQLITHRKSADILIQSSETDTNLSKCLYKIFETQPLNAEFCGCLLSLIMPIQDILKKVENSQQCVKDYFGNILFPQHFYKNQRCISCKSCNLRAPNSIILPITREIGICSCNSSTSCKAIQFDAPKITNQSNLKLVHNEQEYHQLNNIYAFPFGNNIQFTIGSSNSLESDCYYSIGSVSALIEDHSDIPIQFYFEVEILETPKNSSSSLFAIGIREQAQTEELDHYLGYERLEFAYHSNDGLWRNNNVKTHYGPTYGVGDTIGFGITGNRRMFCTKNGIFLGFTGSLAQLNRPVYSAICIRGENCRFHLLSDSNNFIYCKSQLNSIWRLNSNAVRVIFANIRNSNVFLSKLVEISSNHPEVICALLKSLESTDRNLYNFALKEFPDLGNLHCSLFLERFFKESSTEPELGSSYGADESLFSSTVLPSVKGSSKSSSDQRSLSIPLIELRDDISDFIAKTEKSELLSLQSDLNSQSKHFLNTTLDSNTSFVLNTPGGGKMEEEEKEDNDSQSTSGPYLIDCSNSKTGILLNFFYENDMKPIVLSGTITIDTIRNRVEGSFPKAKCVFFYGKNGEKVILDCNEAIHALFSFPDSDLPIINVE